MNDSISRQAAIELIERYFKKVLELNPDLLRDAIISLPSAQPGWIPVTERLPEDAYPVIVTWKNDDPKSYYQYILGKHYTGVAHFKNGIWYWYSSTTEDVLMEYGRCDSEEFDEAIQVLAWQPLPTPYREGGQDDSIRTE